MTTVTTKDFKSKVDHFIDELQNERVYITKNGKRVAVLMDPAELEHLISLVDNRKSYFVEDLPADAVKALDIGPLAPSRPELDYLMNDQ